MKKVLPIRGDLRLASVLTIVSVALMGAASLFSLVFREVVYPTGDLWGSFLANDAANLVVMLPLLLIPFLLARRGRLAGLLLWPGALAGICYNYIAYVFGIPLRWMTAVNIVLVLLAAAGMIEIIQRMDWLQVQEQIEEIGPRVFGGIVLLLFGAVFFFLAATLIVEGGAEIRPADLGVSIADLGVSVLWIGGGVLMLRKRPLGFTAGWGLLYTGVVLNLALLVVLVLRPQFSEFELLGEDVIAVSSFLGLCLAPLTMFLVRLRRNL
jgi:hypothetical protein